MKRREGILLGPISWRNDPDWCCFVCTGVTTVHGIGFVRFSVFIPSGAPRGWTETVRMRDETPVVSGLLKVVLHFRAMWGGSGGSRVRRGELLMLTSVGKKRRRSKPFDVPRQCFGLDSKRVTRFERYPSSLT